MERIQAELVRVFRSLEAGAQRQVCMVALLAVAALLTVPTATCAGDESLAAATPAQALSTVAPVPDGTGTPAPAASAGSAVTVPLLSGTRAGDITKTFLHNYVALGLAQMSWRGSAWFTAKLIKAALFTALLFCVVGLIVGVVEFLILRRLGWVNLTYLWYRYVRWLWLPVCVACVGVGWGYGGAWFGAGRFLCHQVGEERLVDRQLVCVACAAVLAAADCRIEGNETPEQLLALTAGADHLNLTLNGQWRDRIDTLTAEWRDSRWAKLLAGTTRFWLDKNLPALLELRGIESRFLLLLLAPPHERETVLQGHPDARPTLALAENLLGRVRKDADARIRSVFHAHVLAGLGGGLGLPLILIGLTQGLNWLVIRRRSTK